ncbi:helix-turn-helix domain-containing protein [Rhodosalinus sp.]|uniref:helix-turn-helix domain-containing protein n=1 Tax=Rhodosalinus sp. TaxID=2047741 RepID=UPI00397CA057
MLSEERKERNKSGLGAKLKSARTKAGYTQKALASELGVEYYTMISQMELGYISIPPSLWRPIAIVLKLDMGDWVLRCLQEYQPEVYKALFNNRSRKEVSIVLILLTKGDLDEQIETYEKKEKETT